VYISDFARLGQVSVRMLRHYDELGLIRPDHVDPWTGYRSYSPQQLHLLNRLVALKDLGFTLDQVRRILLEQVGPEELRGMLRLRRIELEDEARAVGTRLTAVESRLRMIEMEDRMSADYVIKSLPATRLVARTATLDPDRLGEHIGPMFAAVAEGIGHVPGALATPIATYAVTEAGMDVAVGYGYAGAAPAGAQVIDLPAVDAVCGVHLGSMATIGESWQALHRWIVENGHEFAGPCRELYLRAEGEDQSDWVTELQQPIRR
jgi:DNA-binding transcriptional MerR regulator